MANKQLDGTLMPLSSCQVQRPVAVAILHIHGGAIFYEHLQHGILPCGSPCIEESAG